MPVLNKTVLENNIKTLIATNNLNQDKVAGRMNMSQGNFNKKIRGEVQFTLEEIFNLATILKVPVEALWCENGVPATVNEKKDSKAPTETELRPRIPVIEEEVCRGLAQVFKYASIHVKEIDHQEPVYQEIKDEEGCYVGAYGRKYDENHKDPVNKYLALFFPRYFTLATTFENEDDWSDYITELQYSGNFVESNFFINDFLEKLVSLYQTCDNGHMTREAYIFSINSTLEETLAKIRQK